MSATPQTEAEWEAAASRLGLPVAELKAQTALSNEIIDEVIAEEKGARYVGYWEDLRGMPEQGPFVVVGGPGGANVPHIEHVRGPEGAGFPVCLTPEMYRYREENDIPRGHAGASKLNELYEQGAFVWDGYAIKPKPEDTP